MYELKLGMGRRKEGSDCFSGSKFTTTIPAKIDETMNYDQDCRS